VLALEILAGSRPWALFCRLARGYLASAPGLAKGLIRLHRQPPLGCLSAQKEPQYRVLALPRYFLVHMFLVELSLVELSLVELSLVKMSLAQLPLSQLSLMKLFLWAVRIERQRIGYQKLLDQQMTALGL
jgi:hypothetical protein